MLLKILKNKTVQKYLGLITLFTVLGFLVAIRSTEIMDFITNNHTLILSIAIFILLVALVFQKKQTDILRENDRLYHELQKKQALIDRDLSMARSIQQGILNEKPPKLKTHDISAQCLPAEKIGGDFFSIKEKDNSLHFFIGDVSGHGISSALVMSLTHGLINEIIAHETSPAQILKKTNTLLCNYLENNINFVTLFYGKIDLITNKLEYCSAGHTAGLLYQQKDQKLIQLPANTAILGMFKDNLYENQLVNMKKGDKLILYTDGFIECTTLENNLLGEEGFFKLITKNISESTETIKENIYKEIQTNNIKDDLSLIVITSK